MKKTFVGAIYKVDEQIFSSKDHKMLDSQDPGFASA